MDFQVIFKDSFVEDLERLVTSIAVHDPTAAYNLGQTIIHLAESLSFFPERFPQVRQRRGIRRFVVKKNFKVFYRVNQESKLVETLRCWDGRRRTDPGF